MHALPKELEYTIIYNLCFDAFSCVYIHLYFWWDIGSWFLYIERIIHWIFWKPLVFCLCFFCFLFLFFFCAVYQYDHVSNTGGMTPPILKIFGVFLFFWGFFWGGGGGRVGYSSPLLLSPLGVSLPPYPSTGEYSLSLHSKNWRIYPAIKCY